MIDGPQVESPRVAIGLGSNLGDRHAHLMHARSALERILADMRWSAMYRTIPQHVTDQPWFLNACVVGTTDLSAHDLLEVLQEIEAERDRDRSGDRYGPRSLDLDILLYGREIVETPRLHIPHPRLAERAFALVPLTEHCGDWRHPELGVSVSALLSRLRVEGVERYTESWNGPARESDARAGSVSDGGREGEGR